MTPLAAASTVFELASLASLILSRTANVLGWSKPRWSAGAIIALAGVVAVHRLRAESAGTDGRGGEALQW